MKSLREDREPDENAQEEREPVLPRRAERTSFNELTLQRILSKKEEGESAPRRDCFRAYEVLDLAPLPALASQPKDPATVNLEVLKLRINELYRDMKSRNTSTKNNMQVYLSRRGQESRKEYQ